MKPSSTLVLPIHCWQCGGSLIVEIEDVRSDQYITQTYVCPHCKRTVPEHSFPGKIIRVSMRVDGSLKP